MDTYLTFMIGQELFAVSVSKVLEVLQKQHITNVPKTPEHVLGIINFRGDILSVIDTKQKFNLIKTDLSEKQIVIVFELFSNNERILIAATVDSVKDVILIKDEDIKPVPELGLTYDSNFIKGAVKIDEAFLLMLDVEKVFSINDLAKQVSIKN